MKIKMTKDSERLPTDQEIIKTQQVLIDCLKQNINLLEKQLGESVALSERLMVTLIKTQYHNDKESGNLVVH